MANYANDPRRKGVIARARAAGIKPNKANVDATLRRADARKGQQRPVGPRPAGYTRPGKVSPVARQVQPSAPSKAPSPGMPKRTSPTPNRLNTGAGTPSGSQSMPGSSRPGSGGAPLQIGGPGRFGPDNKPPNRGAPDFSTLGKGIATRPSFPGNALPPPRPGFTATPITGGQTIVGGKKAPSPGMPTAARAATLTAATGPRASRFPAPPKKVKR